MENSSAVTKVGLSKRYYYLVAVIIATLIFPETLWSTDSGKPDEKKVSIHSVTDRTFSKDVINEKVPVLVVYWAEWSQPNKMFAPVIEEIAEDYTGRLKVAKLNVDDSPETTQKYGVRGIPTVMIFIQGILIDTKVGVLPKRQLTVWLDENLKK